MTTDDIDLRIGQHAVVGTNQSDLSIGELALSPAYRIVEEEIHQQVRVVQIVEVHLGGIDRKLQLSIEIRLYHSRICIRQNDVVINIVMKVLGLPETGNTLSVFNGST